jgi:hypothetical protein
VLTACAHHDQAGPLLAGGHAASCFPKRGQATFILGDEDLDNMGKSPVTIDSVALEHPVNLSEIAAFVSPLSMHGSFTMMGDVTGRPFRFYDDSQPHVWTRRVPAQHAVVPPAGSGTSMNLLVVTRSTRPSNPSSTSAVIVRYHDASHSYVWRGSVAYRIKPGTSC